MQSRISLVIVPRPDLYPVTRLPLEVGPHIVHNNAFCEVAPQRTQILDIHMILAKGMVPVQSVCDMLGSVQLVKHPIRVILHSRREHY